MEFLTGLNIVVMLMNIGMLTYLNVVSITGKNMREMDVDYSKEATQETG
jgi:hypothetical protein